MTTLVKCPKCGDDVPVEQWDKHYEMHQAEKKTPEQLINETRAWLSIGGVSLAELKPDVERNMLLRIAEMRKADTTKARTEAAKREKESGYSKEYLVKIVSRMLSEPERRGFLSFLQDGLEALVEVGRLYEVWNYRGLGPLYNNISIAIQSAYEGDWSAATAFLAGISTKQSEEP